MARMPFQRFHRLQGIGRPLDEAAAPDITEIVGRHVGEQCQAHVGRRCPMSRHRNRMLLEIVGRQPVVLRAHECFKEMPGTARDLPQKADLPDRQLRGPGRQRKTCPPRDGRRRHPQQKHRQCRDDSQRLCHDHAREGSDGCRGHDPHDQVGCPKARRSIAIHLCAGHALHVMGGIPLQKPAVRDKKPHVRAHDRVEAEIGFERKAGQGKYHLAKVTPGCAERNGKVRAPCDFARLLHQIGERGDDSGCGKDADHHKRPEPRMAQGHPSRQQQQGQRRRNEAAPEVVHQLPFGQGGQRVGLMTATRSRHAPQKPAGKLPVAPDPPVPAADVGTVARGKFLVQLHIAQQTRPGITPFQKIMAEYPVLRKAAADCLLECVHIVDPFSDERALVKQILVDVGNDTGIRIHAGVAAIKPCVMGPVRT